MESNAKRRSSRGGFTLIELLIVMTIIGILAAIAVPKFWKTRERAHFKALMSDLRNLESMQELYRARPGNNYQYAASASDIVDFHPSTGVQVNVSDASNIGWAATASHASLQSTQYCAVYAGTVATSPAPAVTPGIVTCTGE